MRILYYINLDLTENRGVLQKIIHQVRIWKTAGCIVKIVSLSPENESKDPDIEFSFFNESRKRFYGENLLMSALGIPPRHYKQLIDEASGFNPDVIYFRDIFNYFIINSFLNKFDCPKIYEANTIQKTQLQMGKHSLKKFLDLLYFFMLKKKIYGQVDGIVAVTREIGAEIARYGSRVCVIPNGIYYREILKRKRDNIIPNIVFIGTTGLSWHGVDKIIELASQTQGKLFFHVIGYTKPVEMLPDNVTFYGSLEISDYEPILLNADVAISSAAVYRKKINEGSGLKVREYLLYKIPVIVPYQETIFEKEYDFVLQLPNNEANLLSNIDKIIAFSYFWLNKQLENAAIKPLISSEIIENKRLAFFKELLTRNE